LPPEFICMVKSSLTDREITRYSQEKEYCGNVRPNYYYVLECTSTQKEYTQ
jgi:hypothetical protein